MVAAWGWALLLWELQTKVSLLVSSSLCLCLSLSLSVFFSVCVCVCVCLSLSLSPSALFCLLSPDVYGLLKDNLCQDDAVVGEAAGIAMGLVMLGTRASQAITDMTEVGAILTGAECIVDVLHVGEYCVIIWEIFIVKKFS